MRNSYKYFENRDCKYYPCHKKIDKINCLFCYCPLYNLENCPGEYRFIDNEDGRTVKECSNCTWPHKAENYESIIELLS